MARSRSRLVNLPNDQQQIRSKRGAAMKVDQYGVDPWANGGGGVARRPRASASLYMSSSLELAKARRTCANLYRKNPRITPKHQCPSSKMNHEPKSRYLFPSRRLAGRSPLQMVVSSCATSPFPASSTCGAVQGRRRKTISASMPRPKPLPYSYASRPWPKD